MVAFEFSPNKSEPWCAFSFPPLTDEEVSQIIKKEEVKVKEIAAKCAKYEEANDEA
jgi:hypothetical protein